MNQHGVLLALDDENDTNGACWENGVHPDSSSAASFTLEEIQAT